MILYSLANFWQSSYRKEWVVTLNFLLSFVVNIATWVLLQFQMSPFSYLTEYGTIPLHYNVYFGIDLYGPWYSVFIIPLLGSLVIILFNILAYTLFTKEKLLSLFLIYFQTIFNIMLAAAGVFVILLNI